MYLPSALPVVRLGNFKYIKLNTIHAVETIGNTIRGFRCTWRIYVAVNELHLHLSKKTGIPTLSDPTSFIYIYPISTHYFLSYTGFPPINSLHLLTSAGTTTFSGMTSNGNLLAMLAFKHCANKRDVFGSLNNGRPKSIAFLLIT